MHRLEEAIQQHQRISAQTLADYRNALLEAQRLTPRYRQASQAVMSPTYRMDPDVRRQVKRMRQALVDLVGEEEVQRLVADARYTPWWLTER